MTQSINVNSFQAEMLIEYITDAAEANDHEASAWLKGARTVATYLKAAHALNDIVKINDHPEYPSEIKTILSLAVLAKLFDGVPVYTDIPLTFSQAWDYINNVPSHVGDMSKEEFFQDLANRFPDLFQRDNVTGEMNRPDYIDNPPSEPTFWPLLGVPDSFPEINPAPKPQWSPSPQAVWANSPSTSSPLVLDLDGDGVELTAFNSTITTTFFDIDNDGFAEQTAWLSSHDGLLARDLNENGTIDSASELFGSSTVDGFSILQALDSNGDHWIDQYDAAWSELRIWKDNGNAFTESGELVTLSSLNIVGIDLAGVSPGYGAINGNPISHTSTFKYSSGATGAIVDAWFVHDNMNSRYSGDFTLDPRVLFLPTLRGFGELKDLYVAMSLDSDLFDLVEDLTINFTLESFSDSAGLDANIADILYAWAGVDDISPTSRGPNIDARKLEFMERFYGNDYLQNGIYKDPFMQGGAELEKAWTALFDNLRAQILIQIGAQELFTNGTAYYDGYSGEVSGDMVLSQVAVDALEEYAIAVGVNTEDFWISIAKFLAHTKEFSNFTVTEDGWMESVIYATDPALSWDAIKDYAIINVVGVSINGTSGDDILSGGSFDDSIYAGSGNDTIYGYGGDDNLQGDYGDDVIYGGDGSDIISGYYGNDALYGEEGADTLIGNSGNDILRGGAGGDIAFGGDGDDSYIYDSGDDFYSEYGASGIDTITLPTGITLGDLVFSRNFVIGGLSSNLMIEIDGLGTIEIDRFFSSGGAVWQPIETLIFADASTYSLSSYTELVTHGSDASDSINSNAYVDIDDTVYGYGGDDVIYLGYGDDVVDGGDGNDWISGGTGNDIYLASAGFDKIVEGGGFDVIKMPEGVSIGDIHFLRTMDQQYHLQITIDGLGQILVQDQFSGASSQIVEEIHLFDSTVIDLTEINIMTIGTNGNDYLSAAYGMNNIFDGRDGNDTMSGNAGADTFYFSRGQDLIHDVTGQAGTIVFRENFAVGDIEIYRGGNQFADLILADQDGNKTTIYGHFKSNGDIIVNSAIFFGSTVWDFSQMEIVTYGTSGNDVVYAYDVGDLSPDDVIYTGGGNDQIQAGNGNDIIHGGAGNDQMSGGAGNDTYIYSSGLDSISEQSGTDTLHIEGYTIDEIAIADTGTYNTKITINSGVDEVDIYNQRWIHSDNRIEYISFEDGFIANLTEYNSWVTGTSSADILGGTSGDDVILGRNGNDTLDGAGGNDSIHGGSGSDVIYGGAGSDLLHGGIGNDTLYGQDGLDTLFGSAGADTFVFQSASAFNNIDVIKDFSVAENDAIDLSDLLGGYDPLTDAITDFVWITESGNNSNVFVDQDGLGSAHSLIAVATLIGVTGLTDESSLLINGTLIV